MTKLLDVLRKYLGTLSDGFVTHEYTAMGQDGACGSRLAARSRAEIKYERRDGDKLSEHLMDKHRRGLLNIVQTRVEDGIEGEIGAFCEVIARVTPGYTALEVLGHIVALQWVEAYADWRLLGHGRGQLTENPLAHHGSGLPYEIFR